MIHFWYRFQFLRYLIKLLLTLHKSSWSSNSSYSLAESTGRSGSLFYRTDDGKYLFKTIMHSEVTAFKSFLLDYYKVSIILTVL